MTLRQTGFWRALSLAPMAIFAMGIVQCELTTIYQPKRPDKAHIRVDHLGTYSTKLDEEKEVQGTIFQTTLSYDLEKQGSGWLLKRHLDTLIARGYHKFSMPHELEKKIDLIFSMDSSFFPTHIEGYDSLIPVLSRIEQKEDYKKQLLKGSDPGLYQAQSRDFWRMADLLPRGQKLEAKKPLSVKDLNSKLESFKVDSAQFNGPRPRLGKSCLDYTLYYHRTDSLPLLVEQFYFSALPNRKYRRYVHKPAIVLGQLQFSMDKKTGLPCFQSKTEMADMVMELKEEKAETPVHLYRYEEDIYE